MAVNSYKDDEKQKERSKAETRRRYLLFFMMITSFSIVFISTAILRRNSRFRDRRSFKNIGALPNCKAPTHRRFVRLLRSLQIQPSVFTFADNLYSAYYNTYNKSNGG